MAEKITFNTGAKSYEIVDQDGNDLGVFRFVPTDAGILTRYKETAAFFTSVGDKMKGEDLEEILPELEEEAGEKIDFLLLYRRTSLKLLIHLQFWKMDRHLPNRLSL